MKVEGWEQRYKAEAETADGSVRQPTPLVERFLHDVQPGTALDLAAGTGRNAIWLASRGWKVTAVEGAPTAVDILAERSAQLGISLRTVVADLQKGEFAIQPAAWDAITMCYYLQRNLIEPAKAGLRSGGILIVIVHTTEGAEQPTETRMSPGELLTYFEEWEILHHYEGKPNDPEHRRSVAEIVARAAPFGVRRRSGDTG
ncbi:MAG: class I SAM-dependent methyltransferase [Bryobacteraceae bacterium]